MSSKPFPPGPKFGIPFLGSWDVVTSSETFDKTLDKMAKKYGPIFYFKAEGKKMVVFNNYEAIKEAVVTQKDKFVTVSEYLIEEPRPGQAKVAAGYSPEFEEVRKIVATDLESLFTKEFMEENIQEHMKWTMGEVEKTAGEAFDALDTLEGLVAGTLCISLFGEGFEDDEYEKKIHRIIELFKQCGDESTAEAAYIALATDFFHKQLEKHKENLDEANPADFMDGLLVKLKSSTNPCMTIDNLANILNECFIGLLEMIHGYMYWYLLYLANNPAVQRQIQEEIDGVVGTEDAPTLEHQERLPYAGAAMLELNRLASTLYLTIPHDALVDTEVGGFSIPAGTTTLGHIYAVNRDPAIWEDPESCKPERFLDENGKVADKEELLKLTLGLNSQASQQAMDMMNVLFITGLLQKYTINPPVGTAVIVPDAKYDESRFAKNFTVRAVKRT